MLHAISRTARALETGTTRVAGKFRLPRAPRDQALVSLARAFAKNAVPLARTFVAHAMPATFLADLHAAVDAFEAAGRDHRAARGAHVAARVRIERTIARGFRAVRRLDAIVANHLRGDPAALAEWRRARRIERSPRQNPGRAPATAAPASRRPAAA